MTLAVLILVLVTLQRCGELVLARHNTERLIAQGAFEIAPGHYPAIIAVHSLWLATLWVLGFTAGVNLAWLFLFCVLQALRIWVIATLGHRWTTRIIVLPGSPLVRTGPYRWLSHPNYVVVAAEIAVLPLVFGLPWVSLIFSLLNAAVLFVRIRAENGGLARTTHAQSG
ncbi:isoprenylcysteine carboxyl methyltransferase family protein [Lichenifustis flavocetrariae]|uniref:Isoprenylcysteine carboxyl methyltransferase n=1 Tax=Lichenifustis flavocetrariae TaxID=2949735 RepID=A0AA42CKS3_9HYPH|nr:isoprenylcysteine carboxylmethyltransferase family protein [Lichenifustis flavocetrariae]MCW6506590.1 hypothetical protein [Lichenifustis flavocetrariae]